MGFFSNLFRGGMLLLTAQVEVDMDFYGEYGFREESECTECHADDCCVFLCEDSFGGGGGSAIAVLQV